MRFREMGVVEIESEWTARDRELKMFGGPPRIFPAQAQRPKGRTRTLRQAQGRPWGTSPGRTRHLYHVYQPIRCMRFIMISL